MKTDQNAPLGHAVVTKVGDEIVDELRDCVRDNAAVEGEDGNLLVHLAKHLLKRIQGEELAQELVGHAAVLDQGLELNDIGKVASFVATDGNIQALAKVLVTTLGNQLLDIHGATKELFF
jgi:hypothetical protein